MFTRNVVIQTKLTPPRLTRRILTRPRVTQRLLESLDYRLTIVQAGAGYGKTTALAGLADTEHPLAWYHLSSEDSDPITFFLHLVHTCKKFDIPADALITVVETQSRAITEVNWLALMDQLINDLSSSLTHPAFLILDDFHQIADSLQVLSMVERLIAFSPADLHIILSTRYPVKLNSLNNMKARGEVLVVDQTDLAFLPGEIATLFHQHYSFSLRPEEISTLASETEGWAIALQLFWQGLKSGAITSRQPRSQGGALNADQLFAFLAKEVLDQLSPDVQEFLSTTAVLRDLNAQLCDFIRQANDSDKYLKYLLENSLFVIDLGANSIRYHHLFREFIQKHLDEGKWVAYHRKAAEFYLTNRNDEAAIYHLLKGGLESEAADVISRIGETMISSGRVATINKWITSISPGVLEARPILLIYLGDYARLHSRFEEALGWYRQAEERSRLSGDTHSLSQALHGQAKVFLDTVNPAQAELLLQRALQIADGKEDRENRARLLELLAENKLNAGHLAEAENYRKQAHELREIGPAELELSVRVMLRTGKLDQARGILEARLIAEKSDPFPTPRAHRETLLILALILEFQGEWEQAYRYALEGIARGEQLQSPFVVAVGKMRQGHAALLKGTEEGFREALDAYSETIQIADQLSVPRLKVEAFWGLTRAYGFKGELELARSMAQAGLNAGVQAGDEWISALILLSMGGGFGLSGEISQALEWIERARDKFYKVSDVYGETLARLWQCMLWWNTGQFLHLDTNLAELLRMIHEHHFDFLLTQVTLLGPPQPRILIPMLIHARAKGIQRSFIETTLYALGLSAIEYHPGFQLRVQTLGQFRVWRGNIEITPAEWKREKARQLFQLLVTHRRSSLERDQIIEFLWPGCSAEVGSRNFRVTLSTLLRVLVPNHTRDAESIFIMREGTAYSLRPSADVWIDASEFENKVFLGENQPESQVELKIKYLKQALVVYQGDYLQENLYDDWCLEERERLLSIYLRAADNLASLLSQQEDWRGVIEVCNAILNHDRCWESAYRLLMVAHHRLGNPSQAIRTYQKCIEVLQQELNISPSTSTSQLLLSLFPQLPL